MKNTIIIFAILFYPIICVSQIDTSNVSFVAYWSIGDSYDFQITKVKKDWRNGKLTKQDSSTQVVNFKVIDSTESSYRIQWTVKNSSVNDLITNLRENYNKDGSLDSIFQKYNLNSVIYSTDELGIFNRIENSKGIEILAKTVIDQIEKKYTLENPKDSIRLQNAIKPIKDIYTSTEGIESLLVSEIQFFHSPLGYEYDISEPLEYKQEYPNLLGGKPIMADAVMTFNYVDLENGYIEFQEEISLNPEMVKNITVKYLKAMGAPQDKLELISKEAKVNTFDSSEYQYYFNPGVPHKINTIRTSIVNLPNEKIKSEKRTTIELIYEE